jgi:3-deoxy-D-manno-octulosonate 8-phosphate phosphatase (KDO 8-P phosphatase)
VLNRKIKLKNNKSFKLIAYDFDGVMTNNKAYIDKNGDEMVQINRSDGLGISEIKKLGICQIIISSETNPVVTTRAKKLGINCLQGIDNKKKSLQKYCKENNYKLQHVAFVGNDINDLEAMKIVGYTFCPADAHVSIKKISSHILDKKGGNGVIREIFDILIRRFDNE